MARAGVKVLYWAQAREAAGLAEENVSIKEGAGVEDLMVVVLKRHPRLGAIRGTMKVAVNGEVSGRRTRLADGDEVALLPPVGGG